MSSTFIVTGVAGLVGSHVAEQLLREGHTVVGIDNINDYYSVPQKLQNLEAVKQHVNFTFYDDDIREGEKMLSIFEKHQPDGVAHLAAMANVRYSIGRSQLYSDVNIMGSVNLLEAARVTHTNTFVFASTSSVYGHTKQLPFVETDTCNEPLSAYPASKKAIELMGYTYHNLHEMNFTALRFFSVYGKRARPDMMPFMVTDKLVRGETITLFNAGQMKRDWTYVGDIAAGVVAALKKPLGYEVINIGRGEPVLMADFVGMLEELTGKKAKLETPPAPASEPAITFANIGKARELLGYDPTTPVEIGLKHMWEWYRDMYID
ncbi:UDP-glucose 4-epimerase [Poriferisphaera corsica]|uniref:UDP-glucose 4-epimerase n=1 Tax=Poriferisphaera corsica TaxID=2528020 RepID=A0A517YPP5_9BACT|nr:GDP-mannose 4,6-dehydratase [Poriferisphaera corsica]QDU32178.1 UDP-glucose 4-epimerase [Poriferisphaera corsica]